MCCGEPSRESTYTKQLSMARTPHNGNESNDKQPECDQGETSSSTTVVETHSPGSLGECDVCEQKSATHLVASGDELCGYCLGLQQGYIQRIADFEQDRNKPPLDGTKIQQLDGIRLGDEGSVVRCHRCGDVIRAGSHLFAFASRPAGEEMYGIDYVWCMRDWDAPPIDFDEGVHELVVRGTLGTRSNPARDEQWPVLFNPTITKRSVVSDAQETLSEEQEALREELREKFDVPVSHLISD